MSRNYSLTHTQQRANDGKDCLRHIRLESARETLAGLQVQEEMLRDQLKPLRRLVNLKRERVIQTREEITKHQLRCREQKESDECLVATRSSRMQELEKQLQRLRLKRERAAAEASELVSIVDALRRTWTEKLPPMSAALESAQLRNDDLQSQLQ